MRTRATIAVILLAAGIISLACVSCGSGIKQPPQEPPPAPVPEATVPPPDSTTAAPTIAEPAPIVPPPAAPPPMLDGLVGDNEWSDEHRFAAGWDDGRIWIRPYSSYTYICIAATDTGHTGLNLYIENSQDQTFMLHASYAHGNRFLSGSNWQEMKWGPSGRWTSNVIESVVRSGQRVYIMPEAFEFQISEKLLPAGGFRFMLQFERPVRWVPETADTLSTANWFHYRGAPDAGS
jgi:hypothetical protein